MTAVSGGVESVNRGGASGLTILEPGRVFDPKRTGLFANAPFGTWNSRSIRVKQIWGVCPQEADLTDLYHGFAPSMST